jgi:hypothetical protein
VRFGSARITASWWHISQVTKRRAWRPRRGERRWGLPLCQLVNDAEMNPAFDSKMLKLM